MPSRARFDLIRRRTTCEAALGKISSPLRCRIAPDNAILCICTLGIWSGIEDKNVAAYEEILAALDDSDDGTRMVAEVLLQRSSPQPTLAKTSSDTW